MHIAQSEIWVALSRTTNAVRRLRGTLAQIDAMGFVHCLIFLHCVFSNMAWKAQIDAMGFIFLIFFSTVRFQIYVFIGTLAQIDAMGFLFLIVWFVSTLRFQICPERHFGPDRCNGIYLFNYRITELDMASKMCFLRATKGNELY